MRRFLTLAFCTAAVPATVFAIGSDTEDPPVPTETTAECKSGQVFDSKTKKCVNPTQGSLDDDTLYRAAREFAYAGNLGSAQRALSAMSDQSDDRVLTYWGFTHRKAGDRELAQTFYDQALTANPDNLLARSYLGQAYIEDGELEMARAQLTEIRVRGGRGTWAEFSLRSALESGRGYGY